MTFIFRSGSSGLPVNERYSMKNKGSRWGKGIGKKNEGNGQPDWNIPCLEKLILRCLVKAIPVFIVIIISHGLGVVFWYFARTTQKQGRFGYWIYKLERETRSSCLLVKNNIAREANHRETTGTWSPFSTCFGNYPSMLQNDVSICWEWFPKALHPCRLTLPSAFFPIEWDPG